MISPREVKFYNFNFVVNIIAITLIFPTLSECSDAQRTRRETIQYGGVHIDRREVGICETRYKYLHSMSETLQLLYGMGPSIYGYYASLYDGEERAVKGRCVSGVLELVKSVKSLCVKRFKTTVIVVIIYKTNSRSQNIPSATMFCNGIS